MEILKQTCTCGEKDPCFYHQQKNISQSVLSKLQSIASDMAGQDNQCTAFPIFVVQQRRRIYGLDPEWSGNIVWLCDGSEVSEDDPDLPKVNAEYEELGELSPEYEDWVRTGYTDTWEFVQPFFSEKAAKEYIEGNKHNLVEPRIYVDSAYRNKEWQTLLEVFGAIQNKERKP